QEVKEAVLGVDVANTAGAKQAGGDLVLELAVAGVQIEVPPAAALGPPDHLVGLVDVAGRLQPDRAVLEPLEDQALGLAGLDVHGTELGVAPQAVAADEAQLVARLAPVDIHVGLVLPLRLDADQLLGSAIADEQLIAAHRVFAGQWIAVHFKLG